MRGIAGLIRERRELSDNIEKMPDEESRIKEAWKFSYEDHQIDFPDFYEQLIDLREKDPFKYSLSLVVLEDAARRKYR